MGTNWMPSRVVIHKVSRSPNRCDHIFREYERAVGLDDLIKQFHELRNSGHIGAGIQLRILAPNVTTPIAGQQQSTWAKDARCLFNEESEVKNLN
jgi:hypothetical protein